MPCLLCYETSTTLLKFRHHGFHDQDVGCTFHEYILRIFLNGWMDRIYFLCCSLLILLCNGQNITEYEAYWLMGAPIINPQGVRFTSYFLYFP